MNINKAYLLLGSNQGDRASYLFQTKLAIAELGSLHLVSHIYLTKAWGTSSEQSDHYNQVIILKTDLSAIKLMQACLQIESTFGRVRYEKYAARSIDIDMLFYNQEVYHSDFLTLPHPHLHKRNFALIPLLELEPDFTHPVMRKTIEELYFECEDNLEVLMLDQNG